MQFKHSENVVCFFFQWKYSLNSLMQLKHS